MNDEELDKMIRLSLERDERLEKIERTVMKDLRHRARERRIRTVVRILAAAFGLPALSIAAVAVLLRDFSPIGSLTTGSVLLFALMLGIVTAAYGSIIAHFDIKDV